MFQQDGFGGYGGPTRGRSVRDASQRQHHWLQAGDSHVAPVFAPASSVLALPSTAALPPSLPWDGVKGVGRSYSSRILSQLEQAVTIYEQTALPAVDVEVDAPMSEVYADLFERLHRALGTTGREEDVTWGEKSARVFVSEEDSVFYNAVLEDIENCPSISDAHKSFLLRLAALVVHEGGVIYLPDNLDYFEEIISEYAEEFEGEQEGGDEEAILYFGGWADCVSASDMKDSFIDMRVQAERFSRLEGQDMESLEADLAAYEGDCVFRQDALHFVRVVRELGDLNNYIHLWPDDEYYVPATRMLYVSPCNSLVNEYYMSVEYDDSMEVGFAPFGVEIDYSKLSDCTDLTVLKSKFDRFFELFSKLLCNYWLFYGFELM